jgi:hypothetical protein
LTEKSITDGIINDIKARDYDLLFFILSCSRRALKARSAARDSVASPEPRFTRAALKQDAIHLDTTDMTPGEVASEILKIVRDPGAAGLVTVPRGAIREWKLKGK